MRRREALLALLSLGLLPLSGGAARAEGLSSAGRIRFDVHYGAQGFKVGEAQHEWKLGPERYELRLNLAATGLAGLFGLQYEQRSEGSIGPEGMRPELFVVDQRGRKRDSAHFDWPAARVSLRRDGKERRHGAIAPGDQDLLSLWHQARRHARADEPVTLNVITGKSIKQAKLEPMGAERLKLPVGELETLKMRATAEGGELDIDIWLSVQHELLPVRIRITDDDGGVLDQRAATIEAGSFGATANTGKN